MCQEPCNDTRGLEHGYTLHRRPTRDTRESDGPLTLTILVRGSLRPRVMSNERGVQFLEDDGTVALSYTGLTVFDARHRLLDASFECTADTLSIHIDEGDALYPVTIDPIARQVAYLKASNTGVMDSFGSSVAIFGSTVVVGARVEESGATGVNGDQNDNSANNSGAAYVFVWDGTSWHQEAYLKASNTGVDDQFGESVAISGDTVVVGAYFEESAATGVNGDQADNSAWGAGAAYVFVRDGTLWSQQAYLKASNTEWGDFFGGSVAISGDMIVVGAWGEDSRATGVNGNQGDNSATRAGAVYVFVRTGTTWVQQAYLKASNTNTTDWFGNSVDVFGDTVVIGAHGEASNATGVNGDQSDNSVWQAGAAYVFQRTGTVWQQEAYIKASNSEADDRFGDAVSASIDLVAVGASREDSAATGVDGDQGDNSATDSGAVYVFTRGGAGWSQQAYLKASDTFSNDRFGYAVAVSGDRVLVGAPYEASNATGVNGDQNNFDASYSGAAYLFGRSGTTWNQDAYIKASNTDVNDQFGTSVSMSGGMLVIGAPSEESSATGVNGDQNDNSSDGSGAAYVFSGPDASVSYCFGDPGSSTPCPCANDNDGSIRGSGCANGVFASGARLYGTGLASVSTDTLVLSTTGAEPGNTGLYLQADNRVNGGAGLPFGDGLRCADGNQVRLQIRTADVSGTSSTTIGLAAKGGVSAGDIKRYQYWYRTTDDPPCGVGVWDFNLSNGYEVTWLP